MRGIRQAAPAQVTACRVVTQAEQTVNKQPLLGINCQKEGGSGQRLELLKEPGNYQNYRFVTIAIDSRVALPRSLPPFTTIRKAL